VSGLRCVTPWKQKLTSRSIKTPLSLHCVCVCDSWIISCIKNGWAEGKYILNNSPTHMHTHTLSAVLVAHMHNPGIYILQVANISGVVQNQTPWPGRTSSGKENDQREQTMTTCGCLNKAGGRVNILSNKLWAQGKQQG